MDVCFQIKVECGSLDRHENETVILTSMMTGSGLKFDHLVTPNMSEASMYSLAAALFPLLLKCLGLFLKSTDFVWKVAFAIFPSPIFCMLYGDLTSWFDPDCPRFQLHVLSTVLLNKEPNS